MYNKTEGGKKERTMIKVKKEDRQAIKTLFRGIQDSMVIACIQGYMGEAYVDKLPNPEVGLIVSGEYSFFAGNANSDAAKAFAEGLFDFHDSDETVCIFSDDEPEWEDTLMAAKKNSPEVVMRYGIVQKDYTFDVPTLEKYIAKIPEGYELVMFNEDLYNQAMAEPWSMEFCETFDSAQDYLKRGFGYAAVCEGRLVAGTSTMTVYDGGTEIQVATHPDFRRKGLAMSCAAAFVLECQRRKIRPCWDAENLISKKMALALGYEYKGEYVTVRMKLPK